MYKVYILYSEIVGKYYTGFTSQSVEERLAYHIAKNKSFTNQASDWKIKFTKIFDNKKDAMSYEKKIKKRGAGRFLKSL